TVVIACSCSDEAEALMYQAIKRLAQARERGEDGESVIFFVGRENYPVHLDGPAHYEWGKAQILAQGGDVVIIACGPLVGPALEAGRLLREQKIAATVINNPFVNHVDLETIGAAVRQCSGRVVTMEDHQAIGGMSAQVAHQLAQAGIQHRMKTLAMRGEFGQSAYKAADLYKKHGLTSAKIVEAAQELMR
ncbi:MAG TPA: transketolase C-terminal domain-containing protein, partial [Candidatus Acidoferrum sp.]|nr:transketolase C-terminal domain-containing protein [Candidatus Acidoferrum sp.]